MNEDKDVQSLKIFKGDHFVGRLERTLNGCRLVFDDHYFSAHQGRRFTYGIIIKDQTLEFSGVNLPTYFAGLLPEGLRLKALLSRLKTSEDDMFSLLVASGANPVGDIHFQNSVDEKELKLPRRFSDLQEKLKAGEDPGNSALAGVQDKISADRISLPLSGKKRNKSYILKLESPKFPQGPQNEFLCLKIAKACGIQVNTAIIVKDEENIEGLLIERFDREWDKQAKKWRRFHQEDACQFLDRYPADKYRLTVQEIAEGIGKLATTPEIEILQLLKISAFSYLIGNGDLHGKNISLIEKNGITQFTPGYDILCTALYGDHKMALLMDGKNQNWKRRLFVDFGKRYGVSTEATESMLNHLGKKFAANKEELFKLPLAAEKRSFLEQMFRERLSHLG
jgi:serine/threonine-protein kinase HipA